LRNRYENEDGADLTMMQGITDCGFGGWAMTGAGLLLLVVLILGAAALIKYLFFGNAAAQERREP